MGRIGGAEVGDVPVRGARQTDLRLLDVGTGIEVRDEERLGSQGSGESEDGEGGETAHVGKDTPRDPRAGRVTAGYGIAF